MKLNKLIAKVLTLAVTISVLVLPVAAFAEEAAGEQPPSATSQKDQIVFTHKHTSQRYGYSILCPVQPKVIPASAYNEQDKGDVLLYSGSYDNIKKAWVICINGYDDKVVPENLGTMQENEAKAFLKDFAANYGLEYAQIVEIANRNEDGSQAEGYRYGIAGPTAKEVEVDSDGDGVMDSVAVAENQMMKLFIPGQYGGHFMLGLIQAGGLQKRDVEEFMNAGIYTLQQWPTSGYAKAKSESGEKDKKSKNK